MDTWARGSGPSLRHAKYILYVNISATKLCYIRLHFSLVNVSNPAIRLRCPSSSQRNHDICPSGGKSLTSSPEREEVVAVGWVIKSVLWQGGLFTSHFIILEVFFKHWPLSLDQTLTIAVSYQKVDRVVRSENTWVCSKEWLQIMYFGPFKFIFYICKTNVSIKNIGFEAVICLICLIFMVFQMQ